MLLRSGVRKCPAADKRLQPFKTVWSELSIGGDMLLRGERVVLPKSLIKDALTIAHESHMGIQKTKRYLRSSVWFPRLEALVEEEVRNCIPCAAVTPVSSKEPLSMTPLPPEPWQLVAADIFGPLPSGEKILVLKCLRSKWPEVKVLMRHQTTNADSIIQAMEKMFSVHGIPDTIRTDNGPPFNSKAYKDFSKRSGFQTQKVTPLWPQANGQAESFMKCLGKVVRTAHIEKKDWQRALDNFLLAYRATPHPSTDSTPAGLMFPNRRFKTRLPHNPSNNPSADEDDVRRFNEKAMSSAKAYADKRNHAKEHEISVGDNVLVRQQKRNKLTSYYSPNPYIVRSIKGSMITASRGGMTSPETAHSLRKFHLSLMLPQRKTDAMPVRLRHQHQPSLGCRPHSMKLLHWLRQPMRGSAMFRQTETTRMFQSTEFRQTSIRPKSIQPMSIQRTEFQWTEIQPATNWAMLIQTLMNPQTQIKWVMPRQAWDYQQ